MNMLFYLRLRVGRPNHLLNSLAKTLKKLKRNAWLKSTNKFKM